jgi:hypothetical protein
MNDSASPLLNLPETTAVSETPAPKSHSGHARTGKIARLPKATRDRLNQMLLDGFTCEQIKEALGDEAKDLNANNFYEWRKGGHVDWRTDEFWRNEMRLRQETFTDLLAGPDPIKLPEAGLQVIATSICELLRDICDSDSDDQKTRVEKHVRIANALSRITRAVLLIQQFRDAHPDLSQSKRLDSDRTLTDRETQAIVRKVDQVLGFYPRHEPGVRTTGPQDRPNDHQKAEPGAGTACPQSRPTDNPANEQGVGTPCPQLRPNDHPEAEQGSGTSSPQDRPNDHPDDEQEVETDNPGNEPIPDLPCPFPDY